MAVLSSIAFVVAIKLTITQLLATLHTCINHKQKGRKPVQAKPHWLEAELTRAGMRSTTARAEVNKPPTEP